MSKSLENIEKSILEMYMHNPELAREELAAAGYDINSLVNDGLALIKQHQFQQQVASNKKHLQSIVNKAKALLIEKINLNKEVALTLLAQYQVKVQYRNISTFSEEELNEILKDVDLVKLIEDLEKNA
jgi:uncharacterized protein (DUF2252 family)